MLSSRNVNVTLRSRRTISAFVRKITCPRLQTPTRDDICALSSLLGGREGSVVTDVATLDKYNEDWTRHYKGKSKVLVKPQTTQEVSSILKYCNERRIGIVPQGGKTGLVGGSVPVEEEVILTLERMNSIHSFDEANGILLCDSGCILQTLHEFVGDHDHLMPIDLGAKGSCMIGGNVSTNAGGQYYYRFGSLHANVLGLEVVLADGTVLDLLSLNRKDNTGYDLKHLFIGGEGTLGVVTKVALSCPRLPKSRYVAFLGCTTFEAVVRVLGLAKVELGEILAAFEFMDKEILDLLEVSKPGINPIQLNGQAYPFCVLVESQGSHLEYDMSKMEYFLDKCMESGDVHDGIMAQDGKQMQEMWNIRESCNPTAAQSGYVYKYDFSLPLSEFYQLVLDLRDRLASYNRPDALVTGWGHVIDGNVHLNVITPGTFDRDPGLVPVLEPYVFESVIRRKGSISAEHGLGRCKNDYLGLAKGNSTLNVMRSVKNLFDPRGILNPGKYLPTAYHNGC